MTGSLLVSDPHSGVRLLTINRPARRNALDRATYRALGDALAAADGDEAVRAIVLTGAEGCFTAGNDLSDFQDTSDTGEPSAGLTFLRALTGCATPVIAAVEGFAVGIGTTLLLHCDLAYAGAGATFRMPFVNLGLCPEGASSYLLPRIAGTKKAAELLMLGTTFGPDVACDAGLINAETAQGGALGLALDKAVALAALPPESVQATKRLLRAHTQENVQAALALEAESFHALRRGPAAQAAFARFFKR
ncbi:MAG: enoyl-CoA hydratase [Azorhizobium sp. 32-67-21]|nr:MAG: enoyl-CoA hydratase [Rhizobiales bacterium 12-68-15]OYX88696.1 MAG: enoyl-CoA hydratase [Azorhizobium sp. 32-67-21]